MPDYTMGGATARDVWTYSKRFLTRAELSEEIQVAMDTVRSTNSTSHEIVKDVVIYREGRIRVRWEFCAGEPITVYTQLYVNGSAVGSEHSTDSLSWQSVYEDISISPGDRIQLGAKTSWADWKCYVRNFRLCYTDTPEYIIVLD